MVRFFLILSLFLPGSYLFAQTITISSFTDTSDYLVGDFINFNIEVVANKSVQVIDPIFPDTLTKLELISISEPVRSEKDKSNAIMYNFILAGYDSVAATIPPVTIEYRSEEDTILKRITTDPVQINIHTVPVSTAEEIKDVKSPLIIPLDWVELFLWLLLGLILITIGWLLYRRYQKKKSELPIEEEIIKIPAHIKAFTTLDELEKQQLWQKGKIKEYHSNLTEIIRIYFEERFDLPAMELTTSESIALLRSTKEAENIIDLTNEFLSNADLVKFAKFQPLQSVNEEMMTQARNIVQNTIPASSVFKEEEEINV